MLETEIKKLVAAVQELTAVMKQQAATAATNTAPAPAADPASGEAPTAADSDKKTETKPARKRGRPRKKAAETPPEVEQAAPPPEGSSEATGAPAGAAEAAETAAPEETVTLDDVMVNMREVAMLLRKLGEEHPVAVQVTKRAQDWVQAHGAAKLTQLDPKHYAAARDMLRELLAWAEAQAGAPEGQSAPANSFD